jgi:hypothetical protein
MRAWMIFPILAATLAVLATSPVEARGMTGTFAVATPGRLAIISSSRIANRVFVFDPVSGQFVAFHRRGFRRGFTDFGELLPLGFAGGLLGFGGLVGPGSPAVVIAASPNPVSSPPPPAPAKTAAELPPCHETTSFGVIIQRGTGCSHQER